MFPEYFGVKVRMFVFEVVFRPHRLDGLCHISDQRDCFELTVSANYTDLCAALMQHSHLKRPFGDGWK